jgi:hypothetical protein
MCDAAGLEPSAAGGHPQRIHHQGRAVVVGHRVADDLAGRQVQPGFARYSQPSPVAMKVMSPTSFIPGAGAVKSRPSRSGEGTAFLAGRVSDPRLRRVTPAMPRSRITRSTRLRLTRRPGRRSSAWMRGTP